MAIQRYATAVLLIVTVLAFMPARAQKETEPLLPLGKWSGTIITPQGETTDATYDITLTKDELSITIDVPFGKFPASSIKLDGGKLLFTFSPGGASADCVLNRAKEGSYEGTCKDSVGGIGKISMIPPKKAPPS